MPRLSLISFIAVLASIVLPATAARPLGAPAATAAQREAAWQAHRTLAADSPFRAMHWRSIGPTSQGGRVVAIAGVPGQPDTFYVAYATGGVWKTTDNGQHFVPLTDHLPTTATGAIAVDPEHPDTLWVGTGEANSSRSSFGGVGLFRSDDGGKTFRAMGLASSDRIARIVVDPKDSNTVYVAALGKLYSTGGERGVYRSRDGGRTWQRVLAGSTPWTGAIDLAMDPRNPNVLYAALWDRERSAWNFRGDGPGSGIWKSTDGGDHWVRLTDGFPVGADVGRIGLAIAPSQPDVVYASVDNWATLPPDERDLGGSPLSPQRLQTMTKAEFLRQSPQAIEAFIRNNDLDTALTAKALIADVKSGKVTLVQLRDKLRDANADLFATDIRGLEVYRSDDAGAHWTRANEKPLRDVDYTYGYYFGQIRVAPDNANRVYAEGLPLITSGDGGKTWHGLNAPNVHVDYHELVIDPADPQRMIVGNDGGLAITYDGGTHWTNLNHQAVGQFYSVAYDFAKPFNVYGGLQDNGAMMGSSATDLAVGDDWKSIGGGDGMYVQVDPHDNKRVYTGYQFGWYQRSGPHGVHEVRPRPPLAAPPLRYNWTTPIELSPHNADVVYFGSNRLYRSLDRGDTWQAISPDLTTSAKRGNVPYATITTLAESPAKFGVVWVGTDDGNVWVTPDGGATWNHVDAGLPQRWVSRVEPSHVDPERAYVALNGYRDDDITPYLYRTDDLGRHWTDIARGLPAEAIHVVREDPVNPDVIYVGTDRGVYVSLDRGDHWQSLQANLPDVPVHDLAIQPRDRDLIAGTHGRSVWILDALPIEELTPALMHEALHLYPVSDLQAQRDWWSRPALWFDETPELPQLSGSYWSDAAGPVTLRVLDSDGQPVQSWTATAIRGINRWQWNLLLDPKRALAAENARLAREHLDPATVNWSERPVAQAIDLGQRLYITPGKYTLQITRGAATSRSTFEIKPPTPYKPRLKPPFEPRRTDRWLPRRDTSGPSPAAAERAVETSGR
ncbi:MAG: hypothetical protein KGH73_04875 [Xanthomonadaceae bacterium]|nr:hypothetical protein [Xanthomonadaceae bacterium]